MTVEKRTIRSDIPGSELYMEQIDAQDERKLTVGRGISLSGEITSCDHLIVEGYIEASIKNALKVDIRAGGHFNGKIEVQNAEIYGYFEGDITVTEQLTIYSGACVRGNLQYGSLQVEDGAMIVGNLSVLQKENMVDNIVNRDFSENTIAIKNVKLEVA